MFESYLSAVNLDELLKEDPLGDHQILSFVAAYEDEFPDLEAIDLAIIGVPEDRGSISNKGSAKGPDKIRQFFYQLDAGDFELRLADLGNIIPGHTKNDTYAALGEIISELLNLKIIPIIIGGSHDLTLGQYLGYAKNNQIINMAILDEKIDVYKQNEVLDAHSFLYKIFTETPNFLFNYSHIGYQSHFVSPGDIATLEKLYFEFYRLGKIRENFEETEPIIRDADLVSFDISAARFSDAPAYHGQSPNGFFGEEMCRIARYAGISDKVSSIGFYELNPDYDIRDTSSKLCAQMIWYFIEGFYGRKHEYPMIHEDDFIKYTVSMESHDEPIVFWKSKKSGRWWISIPIGDQEALEHHQLIPCSYADYQMACREEIPERWLRAIEKLT